MFFSQGKIEFNVKWKDWSLRYNTWEPEENIIDKALIAIFEQRTNDATPLRRGPKKRGRIIKPEPDTEEEVDEEDTATVAADDDDEDDDEENDRMTNNSRLEGSLSRPHESTSRDKSNKSKKNSYSLSSPHSNSTLTAKQSESRKSNGTHVSASGESRVRAEAASTKKISSAHQRSARASMRIDDDTDSSSSSSDDQPLSQSSKTSKKLRTKDIVGTKRKAEVLSKESGKIGVTIKTSPEGPPPTKIVCTNVSATPITVPIKSEPAPLSPETPASHPESNIPPEKPTTSTVKNGLAAAAAAVAVNAGDDVDAGAAGGADGRDVDVHSIPLKSMKQENRDRDHRQVQNRAETNSAHNVNSNSGSCSSTSKIHRDVNKPEKRVPPIPTSPRPVPPRLWLPKCSVSDQVIITDVTVNKETVTIRECKMEAGFFQPRHDPFTHS